MEIFVHLQEFFLGASDRRQNDDSSLLPLKLLHAPDFDSVTKAPLLNHLLYLLNLGIKGKISVNTTLVLSCKQLARPRPTTNVFLEFALASQGPFMAFYVRLFSQHT